MKTIIDNAQNIKTLHPNADIDPITKEPLSPENNMESFIRAHQTKAIVNSTATAAQAEMGAAQQFARDEAGVDIGCTHSLKDQVAWRCCQQLLERTFVSCRKVKQTADSPPPAYCSCPSHPATTSTQHAPIHPLSPPLF